MDGLARFRIAGNGVKGQVEVNDQDVTPLIAGVQYRHHDGTLPEVFLTIRSGETQLEGEGVVHIMSPDTDHGQIVCDFLERIDPEELEQAALSGLGLGENGTQAIIDVLKAWANER